MSTVALHRRQRRHWLSGIVTAWLLLLVPIWSTKPMLETEQQSSVSSIRSTHTDSESAVAVIGGSHGAVARVTIRLSFPVGPGLTLIAGLPTTFDWVATAQLPGQHLLCCYSFRFLQLILEHQIAINAP